MFYSKCKCIILIHNYVRELSVFFVGKCVVGVNRYSAVNPCGRKVPWSMMSLDVSYTLDQTNVFVNPKVRPLAETWQKK